MRKPRLTQQEREIEKALVSGEYNPISSQEFEAIAQALAHRKKDAVLNIRVNREDLSQIKLKSKQLGVKYQTFISEFIHRLAHS